MNDERNNQFAPGLGILLLAVFVAAIIGSLLSDFKGVPYGIAGGFIWLVALLGTFALGLVYLAQYLLPLQGNAGWSESFRILLRNYFRPITGFIEQQRTAQPTPRKKRKATQEELPASFRLLGAGMLASHQAVALSRRGGFSRAAGPGFVLLGRGEWVYQLVDLRLHSRRQPVTASTRDGIRLRTSVSVTFRVRQPQQPSREQSAAGRPGAAPRSRHRLYPYDGDAVFRVSHLTARTETDHIQSWTELVAPHAATLLVDELGRYTLDELLETAGAEPLDRVRQSVRQELERSFAGDGIEIASVGVGPFELSEDVIGQRIASWQVGWQGKITKQVASGDAEALRRVKQARARAQVEIIETIMHNIDAMRAAEDADLHEIVMLRLIEVLEAAMANNRIQTVVPEQIVANLVLEASSQMRALLDRPQD
jgi:regulator of protease activity HflC (stomatin/prohibitin superfamily)